MGRKEFVELKYSFNSSTIARLRDQDLARGAVLDLGCADGGAADQLRGICADHLVGIELDRENSSLAQTKYDTVYCGDVGDVLKQLPDHTFSLIVCSDILEHLFDPLGVLNECRRVIAASGKLFISTSNLSNVGNLLRIFVTGKFDYMGDYSHIRLMTPGVLLDLVERSGFEVNIRFYDIPEATRHTTRMAAYGLSLLTRPRVSSISLLSTNTVVICDPSGP
jgi:predicted TPR repeat methyltransferase